MPEQKFLTNLDVAGTVDLNNLTIDNAQGTDGQVLTSTGTGVAWEDAAAGTSETAERIEVTVKNVSGGSLSKGTVVHASPSATPPSGNVIEVIAADYDDSTKMPAIGILNETIADTAEGSAVMMGAVSGIDTSSFSIGDELYVGNLGALTSTKPATAGQLIQKIAVVIKSHASNGVIKIFGAGRSNDVPLPLYIDNTNQRVGVGTSSPSYNLHVSGTTYSDGVRAQRYYGSSGTSSYLDLDSGAPYSLLASSEVNVTNSIICNDLEATEVGGIVASNGPVFANRFYGNGNTTYYVDPNDSTTSAILNGNVGIGTNPSEKLHVDDGFLKVQPPDISGTTPPSITIRSLTNQYQSGMESSGHLTMKSPGSSSNFYWYQGSTNVMRYTNGLYVNKILDINSDAYYLDPASSGVSLHINGIIDQDFSVTDLNSAWTAPGTSRDQGFIFGRFQSSASNKPATNDNANWFANIYSHASGGTASYGIQLAGSNAGSGENALQLRNVSNGSFASWRKVYHEGHKPTYSELGTMDYSNLTNTPTIGDITAVNAGDYLSGGATSGSATLHLDVGASGDWWGKGVAVRSDGVMEVGKYIDFHEADAGTTDYDFRITSASGGLNFSGDIQAPGVYIGSTNTSYDLYNNGTSYLNGNVTIDANLSFTGDTRILNLAKGTTSSQSKLIIGEQDLYGVSFRWNSGSELEFDGFWNSSVTGTRNRDLGSIDVNNRIWYLNQRVQASESLRAPIFYDSSNSNFNWDPGTDNSHRFTTPSGYIDIGPKNTSWCHIYTDRNGFYFNKTTFQLLGNQVWHAGNDGAGSGLDADLLDGNHASAFATSSHTHAASDVTSGTFAAARIAHNSFDIGDTTAETGRSVHETGIYTFNRNNGTLGTGTDSAYYSVLAFGQGTGGSVQIAGQWTSGGHKLYWRSLRDTTDNWWDWKEIYHTTHKPTPSEVGAVAKTGDTMTGALAIDTTTHATLSLDRASTSYDNNVIFRTAGSSKWRLWQDGSDDYLYVRNESGSNNLMTFRSNNTVGINTGTPNATLHLQIPGAAAPSIFLQAATNFAPGIYFDDSNTGTSAAGAITYATANNTFSIKANSTSVVTISSGTTTIAATADIVAYSSDKRLKENVQPIEKPLNKVLKLEGVTYNWNKKAEDVAGFDTEIKEVGLFAQDVQKVLPEAVKLAPFDTGEDFKSKSGEDYLTVQYEKIVPLLVEAIKDQQKQIDELKSIINGSS